MRFFTILYTLTVFALATLSTSAAPFSIDADADSGTVSIPYHRMFGGPDNISDHLIRDGVVINPEYTVKTNEQILNIHFQGVDPTSNTELNIRQLPNSSTTRDSEIGDRDSLPVPNMPGPMHGLLPFGEPLKPMKPLHPCPMHHNM